MNVEIEGIECRVPARYPTYNAMQNDAIRRTVMRLKEQHGPLLVSVHIDRLVPVPTRVGWRADGGCTLQ